MNTVWSSIQIFMVNFEWLFKFSVKWSKSWENYSRGFPLEIKQIGNMDCESILKSNREWYLACTSFYSCLSLVSISTSCLYQANLWKIRQVLFLCLQACFCTPVCHKSHTYLKILQKYGFCNKSFRKDEPLTSWTLLQHICLHFWAWSLVTKSIL